MIIAVDLALLEMGLSNAPYGAVIDSIRLVRRGQDLEIGWHMPNDPIASGKIYLPSGKEKA